MEDKNEKEFSISNDKVLLNFSAKYCTNFESVLDSEGFRRVLDVYLKKSEKMLLFHIDFYLIL